MSFQAPLFLAGLAVVPLALAALLFARRRPAKYVIRFPAAATLAPLVKRSRVRRNVPPALLMLALAALAIALARPEATVAVPVEKASVVLVTDTSGSMNATDVSPNRLAAAQGRRRPLPREGPGAAPGRPRRLRRRAAHGAAPDAGPRAGRVDR